MKLDDFLHNSLDDFDAGLNSEAWNAIESKVQANNLNHKLSKEFLNGYKAPHKANWNSISQQVVQNNTRYRYKKLLLRGVSNAAVIATVGVGIWFGLDKNSSAQQEILANKTSESTAVKSEINDVKQVEEKTHTDETTDVLAVNNTEPSPQQSISEKANLAPITPSVEKKTSIPKLMLAKRNFCLGESIRINTNLANNELVLIDNNVSTSQIITTTLGKHKIEIASKLPDGKFEILESRTIEVFNRPNTEFSYSTANQFTTLKPNVKSGIIASKWHVGNSVISEDLNAKYIFTNRGKYQVKHVAENEHGCKDSSTQLVRILKAYNLMATQVFNPEKESWLPIGLRDASKEFELRIVSEKGETVFVSESSTEAWNGILGDSDKLAEDGSEFYWVAKVKNESTNKFQEFAGSFLISRQPAVE